MRKIIKIGAQVRSMATTVDKGWKICFVTGELKPDETEGISRLQNAYVYLAIKVEEFGAAELEALEKAKAEGAEFGLKTDSQLLRHVLFRLWEVEPDGFKDSDSHYTAKMKAIIKHYKSKLP